MADGEIHELTKAVALVQQSINHLRDGQDQQIKLLERLNGKVARHGEVQHEHDKRIGLVEQFNRQQVEPALKIVESNKMEIAKRTALYGLLAILGSAAISGLIQWLIHMAT